MDGRLLTNCCAVRLVRFPGLIVGALLIALLAGCSSEPAASSSSEVNETSGQSVSHDSSSGGNQPLASASNAPSLPSSSRREPPREYTPGPGPAPILPVVLLTSDMQSTCMLGVGDIAPNFTLPKYRGDDTALYDLLGQRLTVLVFWKSNELLSAEQFARLDREVYTPYAELGVQVVSVHEGETTPDFEQLVSAVQPRFPVLLDTQENALRSYASDYLPRTYLLDADGRVLWFDLEYSRSTRRELDNAIRFNLLDSP